MPNGPVGGNPIGPLLFAEAEILFRLALANFGGEESWAESVTRVFDEERSDGNRRGASGRTSGKNSIQIRDAVGS